MDARPELFALLILTGAPALRAQAVERVEVEVTFVTGNTVFLNKGRSARIAASQVVVLRPPRGGTVRGAVAAASASSSSVTLAAGHGVRPGTTGYVLVPPRSTVEKQKEPRRPRHPPWQRSLAKQSTDTPLLATAYARTPAGRPMKVGGRLYGQGSWTRDRGAGRSSRYLLARAGADLRVSNAFDQGGVLHFDGELTRREVRLADAPDRANGRARIDRLSYRWGDDVAQPVSVEVGRFLSRATPELGVLDGIEGVVAIEGGGRIGLGVGALPEPFAALSAGRDIAAALSYQQAFDAEESVLAGVAYQKSWHRGRADRDLVVGTVGYNPGNGTTAHGTVWVDYYGSGDHVKSSGFEVTQLQLQASRSLAEDVGVSASMMHMRWPELLRNEFASLPPALLRDNRLTRFDFDSWQQATERVRFDERISYWVDQDDSGLGGEVRATARDLLYEHGVVSLALSWTDAGHLTGPGLRLSASRWIGTTWLHAGYRVADYDAGNDRLLQQDIDAGLDFDIGELTTASLSVDWGFGDGQDSVTLGLFLQKRL